jgi:hypothetical protein
MDPLVQIEWIAGGSAVMAACGAGTIAFVGAVILSKMNARAAADKERRDYARQDEVALRLIKSNRQVVETAATTFDKLDGIAATAAVIHTLVNSDLTKAIQGQLDAVTGQLKLAEEAVAVSRERGTEPSAEIIGIIEAGKEKISELQADLAQRAKQQTLADAELRDAR